jgi:hypothetical protein
MQPIGPVIVGRIDVVRRADYPHTGVHRRLEQFAGFRVVAVEAARLLGDDHVPAVGLYAGPHLIDARAVGDFAAHLGLLADLDRHLRRLRTLGQAAVEEGPAGGDLVIDARLPLLLGGEPGMDEDAKLAALRQQDRLAEVHHRAPPFPPLPGPRRPPRFVVPDFAPGDPLPSHFSRVKPRLLDPCRGYLVCRSLPAGPRGSGAAAPVPSSRPMR